MIQVKCSFDKMVKISDLKRHPRNPNKHTDDQIQRLAQILEYQGWRSPIKVSKQTGLITAGHGRVQAAELIGDPKVPVNFQDYTDSDQEYADIVSDNAIAEWSNLDLSMINTEVPDLGPDFDIDLLGIDGFEIDAADKGPGDGSEDKIPEVPQNIHGVKLGDIWTLGNHRVMCGDSTDSGCVARLMGGEKADMVFTDPPYQYSSVKGAGSLGVAASKVGESIEHMSDFDPTSFLAVLPMYLSDKFCAYIFSNVVLVRDYMNWAFENKKSFNLLTWHKKSVIPANNGHHFPDTEYCTYIASKPIWNLKQDAECYRKYWMDEREVDKLHPTMKPVAIIERCIKVNSNTSVADPFLGSGSTLIACEKTGRRCMGLEIDPHYCSVIIERYNQFTGEEATLDSRET